MRMTTGIRPYGPKCVDIVFHEPDGKWWRGFKLAAFGNRDCAHIVYDTHRDVDFENVGGITQAFEGPVRYRLTVDDEPARTYKKSVVTIGRRYGHKHVFLSEPLK